MRREVTSGLRWSAVGRYSDQAVGFIATVILVRLLSPSAYGIYNMAFLATGLALAMGDLGISSAVIQRRALDDGFASSLYWLNLVAGGILTAALFLAAPLVGVFFDEPAAVPVLQVLSMGLLLGAVGAIPRALLMRELAFRRIAGFQLAAALAGGVAGVALALAGYGVWSLVAQHLVRLGTESLGLLLFGGFVPRLVAEPAHMREVAGYSVDVTGAGILAFILRNVDNALIGRYLGSTALGYYEVAWRLIQYPLKGVSDVVGRVLLPTLARLQGNRERFAGAYLRAVAGIALASFPLLLGLFVLAGPFVIAVLGEQWTPAIILIVLLVPVGLAQSIGWTTGKIYLATGATRTLLRWTIFASLAGALSVVVGIAWGLVGVATARLISNTLLSPLNFWIALRQVNGSLVDLGRALRPIAIAALIMAAVVAAVRVGLPAVGVTAPATILIVGTGAGAVTYFAALAWIRPPVLADVLSGLGLDRYGWSRILAPSSRVGD